MIYCGLARLNKSTIFGFSASLVINSCFLASFSSAPVFSLFFINKFEVY